MRLLIARAIAFFVDSLVIAGFTWAISPVVFLFRDGLVEGLFPIVAGILVVIYFVFWETHGTGQTPGRQLLGINIEDHAGRRLGFYESFLRIAAAFALPMLLGLVPDMLHMYRAADNSFGDLWISLSLQLAGILLWPISILFGRGRVGLFDMVAQTEARFVSEHRSDHVTEVSDWRSVVASIAVTALISMVGSWPMSSLIYRWAQSYTSSAREEPNAFGMDRFIVDPYELARTMRDAGRYFNGGVTFQAVPWSRNLEDDYSLAKHLEGLGDVANFRQMKLVGVMRYTLDSTWAGVMSGDYQHAVAMRIGTRTAAPDYLLEFVFSTRVEIGYLVLQLRRKMLGFWLIQETPAGRIGSLIVAEPDKPNELEFSVQAPGLESGSSL